MCVTCSVTLKVKQKLGLIETPVLFRKFLQRAGSLSLSTEGTFRKMCLEQQTLSQELLCRPEVAVKRVLLAMLS